MESNEIKAYSIQGVKDILGEAGMPTFRATQVLDWLYAKRATSYASMTNLPKNMRENLAASYPLFVPEVVDRQLSADGTRKYLLRFHDGALAETVGLPSSDGRLSVCCSSQSGCAMACSFCATGKNGLTRNLLPGEIVDQVNVVAEDFGSRVTNVVVMGQGEPFANYDNVIAALEILNDKELLDIGARHITVSTCGLTQGIERFSEEGKQYTLAVSLHSAVQKTRDTLMPRIKNIPLSVLRSALVDYTEHTNRRFSFEYALMKGVNDSEEDLRALIEFAQGLLCHVNIIPLNKVAGSPYQPCSTDVHNLWVQKLEYAGIPATIRRSRGSDIDGACGQLANQHI